MSNNYFKFCPFCNIRTKCQLPYNIKHCGCVFEFAYYKLDDGRLESQFMYNNNVHYITTDHLAIYDWRFYFLFESKDYNFSDFVRDGNKVLNKIDLIRTFE